jgi:branched-subunit amino acid aminotransferase/4-amino-4-deoxychorismate lyase
MTRLTSLPERALELASVMGGNLKQAVPTMGQHAGKWLETGAKLGALKGGAQVAGRFVRRHPVLIAASVAGAGLLWYAAYRRKARANADDEAIEGNARRVDARRAPRAPRQPRHRTTQAED